MRPKTVEDVQSVIKAARKLNLRVRTVEQSLSWSPLSSDGGHVALFTEDIKRDGEQMEVIQVLYTSESITLADHICGRFYLSPSKCMLNPICCCYTGCVYI